MQDLDLLQVKLGRGGGYIFKAPSPVGVIRHVFAWLAARHFCPFELMDLMGDLLCVNVRLAGETMAKMSAGERRARCEELKQILLRLDGAERFTRFQQSLSDIAMSPVIDTFARCIISYQTRKQSVDHGALLPDFVDVLRAIVNALDEKDVDRAEALQRAMLNQMREATLERFGVHISVAAE